MTKDEIRKLVNRTARMAAKLQPWLEKIEANKTLLKNTGAGRYEGDVIDIVVSDGTRSGVSKEQIVAALGAQWYEDNKSSSTFRKAELKAKPTKARVTKTKDLTARDLQQGAPA